MFGSSGEFECDLLQLTGQLLPHSSSLALSTPRKRGGVAFVQSTNAICILPKQSKF